VRGASAEAVQDPVPVGRGARKTKRLADIAAKLELLAQHADRQHRRERAETEALVPILRRLVAIERRLRLVEEPQPPRHSRRRPLGPETQCKISTLGWGRLLR